MKTKKRIILFFLAVMLCMAAFSGTALAVPEDDAPADGEPETEVPEETEEELSFEDFFSGLGELFGSFTPEGNLTLVDNYVMDGSLATYTAVPPQFAASATTGEDFSGDQTRFADYVELHCWIAIFTARS